VFAFARLAEDTLDAGTQFFKKLRGMLEDRLTDLSFVRQRLRHLQLDMSDEAELSRPGARHDDPLEKLLHGSSTVRVVLPDGVSSLEDAADSFVRQLNAEMYRKLDAAVQALVLAPLGGLQTICQRNSDLSTLLAGPLVDQTAAFLAEQLPVADVAEVERSAAAVKNQPLEYHIQKFYRSAAPLVSSRKGRDQTTYLIHPNSEASQAMADAAKRVLPQIELISGSNPTDLTFCREQSFLAPEDISPLMGLCRSAYDEVCTTAVASPHSRFDVQEWLPLET
jgi:hypothetical protein